MLIYVKIPLLPEAWLCWLFLFLFFSFLKTLETETGQASWGVMSGRFCPRVRGSAVPSWLFPRPPSTCSRGRVATPRRSRRARAPVRRRGTRQQLIGKGLERLHGLASRRALYRTQACQVVSRCLFGWCFSFKISFRCESQIFFFYYTWKRTNILI